MKELKTNTVNICIISLLSFPLARCIFKKLQNNPIQGYTPVQKNHTFNTAWEAVRTCLTKRQLNIVAQGVTPAAWESDTKEATKFLS